MKKGFSHLLLKWLFPGALAVTLLLLVLGQIVQYGHALRLTEIYLQRSADRQAPISQAEQDELLRQLHARIDLYEEEVKRSHLLQGMVVNRRIIDSSPRDVCDSLLFSSLRFVALSKLGRMEEAAKAWEAIAASQLSGQWLRHPSCLSSTSRDMILGLLVALSQTPAAGTEHFRQLISTIAHNKGYFASGPFYVSYVSPGLVQTLRQMSLALQIEEEAIPAFLQLGFSSIEFNTMHLQRGYTSHLLGLQIWLELEMQARGRATGTQLKTRTLLEPISQLLKPFTEKDLLDQRLQWMSEKLANSDQKNLFFRWLRLKTTEALTPTMRFMLMQELLNMPQFPRTALPQDCDRKADYLWQRDSVEYQPQAACELQYNGIDFLWMASLLVSD